MDNKEKTQQEKTVDLVVESMRIAVAEKKDSRLKKLMSDYNPHKKKSI